MENKNNFSENTPPSFEYKALPEHAESVSESREKNQQRKTTIAVAISGVVLLVLVIGSTIFLLQPSTPTDKIRDIFIIFMALQMLLIGMTLVVLIIQLARLINLLQNEIKPMLKSTNETANTLRGTAIFLSDNLTEPVMKLNESLAALKQLRDFFKFTRK